MSKIAQLSEQQKTLLDQLFWLDEEDGEDYYQEQVNSLHQKLASIKKDAQGIIEYLAPILIELNVDLTEQAAIHDAYKSLAAAQAKKVKSAENKKNKLRDFILAKMQEFAIEKAKTPYGNFSVRETVSLGIDDNFVLDEMPAEFVKVEKTLMKAPLLTELKDGACYPGLFLSKKPALFFR